MRASVLSLLLAFGLALGPAQSTAAAQQDAAKTFVDAINDVQRLPGSGTPSRAVKKATDLTFVSYGSGIGRARFKLTWCTRRTWSPSLLPGGAVSYTTNIVLPGIPYMAGSVIVFIDASGTERAQVTLYNGVSKPVHVSRTESCVIAKVPVSAFAADVTEIGLQLRVETSGTPSINVVDFGQDRQVRIR